MVWNRLIIGYINGGIMKNRILKKLLAIGISAAIVMLSCTATLADETEDTEVYTEETAPTEDTTDGEVIEETETIEMISDNATDLVVGIPIDSSHFPDAVFRSYVSNNFDISLDGTLSQEEIAAATSVDFGYNATDCHDLTGIEYFTQLVDLRCNGSGTIPLTIDVSHNTLLESLVCNQQCLTSLNLNQNTALTHLSCYGNKLQSLHLTNNTNLRFLDCADNRITILNLSGLDSLETLYCHFNPLTSIDISTCGSLASFSCYGTPQVTLDISGCPNLITAYTSGTIGEGYHRNCSFIVYSYQNVGRIEYDPDDVIVTESVPDTTSSEVSMYRLYNTNSGEHFYTASAGERDVLINAGWNYENIGWIAPAHSNTPVYRLYNENGGEHHYTTSVAERDLLISLGWNDEGIGWYSDDNHTVPLYRQYNPNAFANNHNYTTSLGENDWLVSIGWRPEGIGWYGIG